MAFSFHLILLYLVALIFISRTSSFPNKQNLILGSSALKDEITFVSSNTNLLQSQLWTSSIFDNGILTGGRSSLFESVSSPCMNHSQEFFRQIGDNLDNIFNAETWALQMADAWGKLPEGILRGHIAALGDYDECVGIRWKDNARELMVQGKYCTNFLIPNINISTELQSNLNSFMKNSGDNLNSRKAGSPIDIIALLQQSLVTDFPLFPSLGSCLPSSCTQEDANQLIANILKQSFNDTLIVVTMNCETDEKILTAGDYAMISVLSVLCLFLFIGTAIDIYLLHNEEKRFREKGILEKVFISFSIYTNLRKWWSVKSNSSDDFGCLHGIKFFSTSWVILGHTFFMYINQPVWNTLDLYRIYDQSALYLVILNAGVVVDTFFTVGGFLVSYNLLKFLDKTKGKLNIPLMYIKRYIRLTPAYALILGFCTTLITHLSSGPHWWVMRFYTEMCKRNWWTNLLYINSVVKYHPEKDPVDLPCHGEAWYLSSDMMFFLISPFLIYPLWRKQKLGIPFMTLVTIVSVLIPCIVTYTEDFKPVSIPFTDTKGGSFSRDGYMVPWVRGTPYAVGIWLGFLLYKNPNFFKIPKVVVILAWLGATGMALTVLFGIHHYYDPNYNIPKVEGAIYAGFHRLTWGLSIAWLIFACARGYGGFVNKFLSWKGFIPLGRLGYCVFLVSLQLQLIFHLRYRQSIQYDLYSAINLFFAHMVTSYLVGFVCSITMEAPFMQLEKIVFGTTDNSQKKKENPS